MDFGLKGKIIFRNREWAKKELQELSDKLSTFLQLNHVTSENVVAIAMDRTPMLLVTIITLLNRSILFLPINEELPSERLEYMLDNAGVDVILTDTDWLQSSGQKRRVLFFDETQVEIRKQESNYTGKQDLAYILFTSGSTGKPKAVEVLRSGLENFIHAISERIIFPEDVRIACFTSEMFDIFFLESVFAMHNGMTIVLADRDERNNPKKMIDLIVKEKVNVIQMTPTSFQMLEIVDNDLKCLEVVDTIMVGGEKFPMPLLKKLQYSTRARIYNMYGPTETTIWSTIAELTSRNEITIGTPVLNTEVYIVDDDGKRLGVNEEGEICIAGGGLARGYRNNQEQTAHSFIDIVLNDENKRIYKTGDVGYQREDGEFVCLGRKDLQIKIRGHRIELEEIEENLVKMCGVENAVTSVYEEKYGKKIICFYTALEDIEESKLRQFLEKKLPQYMIPSHFVRVEKFEYTTSKKIDRKKMIQAFEKNRIHMESEEKEISRGKSGTKILQILHEIIGQSNEKIGYDSAFQEIGMDSVMYINFIVQLEEEFQIEINDKFLQDVSAFKVQDIVDFVNEQLG